MVRNFFWIYIKVLLAIAISIAFGGLVLVWRYGFEAIFRAEMLSNVVIDLIIILIAAFIVAIIHVALDGRQH